MARRSFQDQIDGFRNDLLELAGQALEQVEHAIVAWEESDADAAYAVIDAHNGIAERRAELEERTLIIQILQAPVARDARLLHVGLIAVVALERVARLAVEIARLALRARPFSAVPEVRSHVQRMADVAVDAFSDGIRSLAAADLRLGERAVAEADEVAGMNQALIEMANVPEDDAAHEWFSHAVLVGRHLDRIANNGAELGGRAETGIAAAQVVGDG